MTEPRHTADTITDDDLDALHDERDRYFRFACAARGASGARTFPDLTDTILALVDRAEKAEAAIERVRKLATRWAVLRAYGSAATELRAALDDEPTA